MLLVRKLRHVNQRLADPQATRHSTQSILSAKRTKSKDTKLRHFGSDASFVGLAVSAVKRLPRLPRQLKCLTLILMNELSNVDISDAEALWNRLVDAFHAGSDLLSKQLLVLFVSRFLNRFQAVKELNIEMKKNCSRNSQFQFRLMQSLSFNEENELKAVKRHIVHVVSRLFSGLLGANFNDDTLLLAILRLGHVGRFSEDVIRLILLRMLDLSPAYNLMLLCHKYKTGETSHIFSHMKKNSPSPPASHFRYDYREYVCSKDFDCQRFMMRFSRVEIDPHRTEPFRVNSCQELTRMHVESQELNMSNFSKELISRSNLRIGINVPKKSRLVDAKQSKDFLKSPTYEGTLIRIRPQRRSWSPLPPKRGHESHIQTQLPLHANFRARVSSQPQLCTGKHFRGTSKSNSVDSDAHV